MKLKILKFLKRLRARFPSRLPLGIKEFENWADSFSQIYELPTSDRDSIHYALATMIINMRTDVDLVPKHVFYKLLRSSAAKQIAGTIFHDIKVRQAEKAKNENAQKANNN